MAPRNFFQIVQLIGTATGQDFHRNVQGAVKYSGYSRSRARISRNFYLDLELDSVKWVCHNGSEIMKLICIGRLYLDRSRQCHVFLLIGFDLLVKYFNRNGAQTDLMESGVG